MASSKRHIITRTYGNLKGFSTDSSFLRPPYVAEQAVNLMRVPDRSFSPRRGYQCLSADIGGLGNASFDNPCRCGIEAICLHRDGNLYRLVTDEIIINFSIINPDVWLQFSIYTNPNIFNNNPGWSFSPWSITPWASPSGESITFSGFLRNSAIVNGNQSNVNTINVLAGHVIQLGNTISIFNRLTEQFETRTVSAVAATSITFTGLPVSVLNDDRLDVFFEQLFLKGFDVITPYPISQFITFLNTINGVSPYITGPDSFPAAFIPIVESVILTSGNSYTLTYSYWEQIPSPIDPLLPGSASIVNQNSPDFENASFAVYEEILFCTNGYDPVVKYDGQNAYVAGMKKGDRPSITAGGAGNLAAGTYQYAIAYEQKDKSNHIIEGVISDPYAFTSMVNTTNDVRIVNIASNSGYNTNGAIAVGGASTVYGPDSEGYYYHYVQTLAGQTMLVGDVAYYLDTAIAQVTAGPASTTRIPVTAGYGTVIGDTILFTDNGGLIRQRQVVDIDTTVSPNILEISGGNVDVSNNPAISSYIEDEVFGHIAIVNGNQTNVTTVIVDVGHTIVNGDTITLIDSSSQFQKRIVTGTAANSISFGLAVSVSDNTFISSDSIDTNLITLRTTKLNPITLAANSSISNNLRINIYRSATGGTRFSLVAAIPNNSFNAIQNYIDNITDIELGRTFSNPARQPNPPPICKYITAYQNMMIYAGGSRDPNNTATSLDAFYFSQGDEPESVPAATNFGLVPSNDDSVSGVGTSGSVLVIGKDSSIYAISGDLLTSQYDVIPVAPGSNIGIAAHATICSVGGLMYFLHTNGVYAMSESQLFPTDKYGRPVPLTDPIDVIFGETPYEVNKRFVFKRAVATNFNKDNQYLLFLPCEDVSDTVRNANSNSRVLCFDYEEKNWFSWTQINAAGGFLKIGDNLYWQERRLSGFVGNTANLYQQHRHYRLIDYADHTSPIPVFWSSSWEDLTYPEVRKKFIRCMLLLDRVNSLYQFNIPPLNFSTYLNRYPNLKDTIAEVTTFNNGIPWGSQWSWSKWSGLVDSFIRINLKNGTVAKSMQISLEMNALNTSFKFQGFQLEVSPDYEKTFVR